MRSSWFAFALFFLTALLACGEIISHTYIKTGEQFVLGGRQRGAFRVKVRNSGPVPISVAERRADGAVQERGRLEPGQGATLAFGKGSAALVRNLGGPHRRDRGKNYRGCLREHGNDPGGPAKIIFQPR